jgi:hypothetical protein
MGWARLTRSLKLGGWGSCEGLEGAKVGHTPSIAAVREVTSGASGTARPTEEDGPAVEAGCGRCRSGRNQPVERCGGSRTIMFGGRSTPAPCSESIASRTRQIADVSPTAVPRNGVRTGSRTGAAGQKPAVRSEIGGRIRGLTSGAHPSGGRFARMSVV